MKTIVIDREYGSGGRKVAKILSERLGINYYDGDLLVKAAEQSHIDFNLMQDYDEQRVGSMLYNIAMIADSMRDNSKLGVPHKIYEAQSRIMKQLVAEKPCIFLGRCADEILKDTVPILKVFIYSDNVNKKAERIAKLDDTSVDRAAASLHKKDLQRANYYHFYTNRKWGDMVNYDICINTGSIMYEEAADIIITLTK